MGIAIAWVALGRPRGHAGSDRQADRDGDAELGEYNARLGPAGRPQDDDEEVRR